MSAQTQPALELRPLRDFPTTPVIIKVGGGGDPCISGDPNSVEITSDFMPFRELEPGLTWETSQSTFTGRIRDLVIVDGGKPVGFRQSHPDLLAAVTINYGPDHVTLQEFGNPIIDDDVVLMVVSEQRPFNVTTEPDWSNASTTFKDPVQSVRFTAGEILIVEYSFVTANPKLLVNFDLNLFNRNL